eukprot:280096_1
MTCDNTGKSPIFTEFTYNGASCDQKPITTQTINNNNLMRSDSYNCVGEDCNLVFRLYDKDPNPRECDKTSDFKDEAFIQGNNNEIYIANEGTTRCIRYDCSPNINNVVIKDCWDNDNELANLYGNVGICDAYLNKYFGPNGLIHCGPSSAYDPPFWIPDPPTKSEAPTKAPTPQGKPKDTQKPTYKPTKNPITLVPTPPPNVNVSISPTTKSIKTTDTYTSNFPIITETLYTSEYTESLFSEAYVVSNDNIYSLPAIPIEGLCFMLTTTMLVICVYYLFISPKTKNVVELYLKPFIVSAFILNTISIACIMSISIILQTMAYTEHTYKMALIPYFIASGTYVLGRFCLQSVFMLRVYSTFKNNIFKIAKTVLISLFILMITVSALWFFVFLADPSIQASPHYKTVYILAIIFDALLIISLLYLFIKRLQRVIIREAIAMRSKSGSSKRQPTLNSTTSKSNNLSVTSADNADTDRPNRSSTTTTCTSVASTSNSDLRDVHVNNMNKEIYFMYELTARSKCQNIAIYFCCCMMNDKEMKSIKSDLKSQNSSLVFIMTKLCLLSSISLITTAIFGIYLFYDISMNQRYVAYALWTCDICINSVCLFLNFAFSNKLYKKICKLPHNACQYVMENSFAAKISTNENENVNSTTNNEISL